MIPRLLAALRLAATQVRRSLVRSALTSTGIAVGIAAVIAVVGIGGGAKASIAGDLATMGSNLFLLESGRGGGPQAHIAAAPFTTADLDAIARQVPHLSAVAPEVQKSLEAVAGGQSWQTTITGSTPGWFVATTSDVTDGRPFTTGEARAGAAVCVIGETVREELFGDVVPLGASVRVGQADCEIVGVLAPKGENTMGMDQDDRIVAPLGFVQRRLTGSTGIERVMISVESPAQMDEALATLDAVVRDLRHVTSDATVDYEVHDTRQLASLLSGITTVLTGLLSAVAAVSLVVGGIGVMNVMLVSVTERTREIGVRMAVGALEGDVMAQFLLEAVLLAGLGGVVGVVVGVAATGLGSVALGVPFVVEPWAVVVAVVASAGIGVLFGWMPARRAARLEPMDAVRSP